MKELLKTKSDFEEIPVACCPNEELLNDTQQKSRSKIRHLIDNRQRKRIDRVQDSGRYILGKADKGIIVPSRYEFTTGSPVCTEVIVVCGIVGQPEQASFEIIPNV